MKTQRRTLDCPFNFLPPRSVGGWLLRVRPVRAKRSQVMHSRGSRCGKKRHLALQGRVSHRDPAVPMRGSDAAVAAGWQFHPVTLAHGCKEQQSGVPLKTGGHPPQRRPTRGLAGDCPKDQRAPTQGLGRPRCFSNTVGTHVSLWTLAVTCPRSFAAVVHFASMLLFAKGCLSCRLVSNSTLLRNNVCLHLPWLLCFWCSLVVSTAQRKKSNKLVLWSLTTCARLWKIHPR